MRGKGLRHLVGPVALVLLAACTTPPAPTAPRKAPKPGAALASPRSDAAGGLVSAGGAVAGNNGGAILSNNGGSLTGKVKAPASLISDRGGAIISDAGGSIISDNGGGIIGNNGGRYGVLAAPEERPLAGAAVTLVDAAGQPVRTAAGAPFATTTDAEGAYRFTEPLPARNLLVVVTLPDDRGRLVAVAPREGGGKRVADVDLASSLATGFILDRYVKPQADPVATFERLTAEADATTRARTAAAVAAQAVAPPARLTEADAAATVEALRAKDAPLRDQLEVVRKLLIAAGQSNLGEGRLGTEVAIPWIRRILAGPDGALYLAGGGDRRVWRLGADGRVTTVVGKTPDGGDADLDGKPAAEASLHFLEDIAFDARGRLVLLEFHQDGEAWRVSRVEPDGRMKTLVPLGEALGRAAEPIAVFGGPAEAVRVLCRDGRSFLVAPDGAVAPGPTVPEPPYGLSSDMHALDDEGRAYMLGMIDEGGEDEYDDEEGPQDPGEVALGEGDDQVYGVVRDGVRLATVRSGVREGMTMDARGNVFYLDLQRRLVLLRPDGTKSTLLDPAPPGFALTIGAALLQPDGTAYVVSDRGVVMRIRDGAATPVAGTPGDAGGAATETSLQPAALAVAPDGTVYASDRLGHRVVKIAEDGALTTVAGTGLPDDDGVPASDGGVPVAGKPATAVRLYEPGVVRVGKGGELFLEQDGGIVLARIDAAGTYRPIWLDDAGYRVQDFVPLPDGALLVHRQVYHDRHSLYQRDELVRLDPATKAETIVLTWEDGDPEAIEALAARPDGSVYLLAAATIRVWRGGTTIEAGTKLAAPIDFDAIRPSAILDPAGRLLVVDETHLLRVDPATGAVAKVAGPGTAVLGGAGVDDGLARPGSPGVGPDGSVWVVDYDHKQVKRIPAADLD